MRKSLGLLVALLLSSPVAARQTLVVAPGGSVVSTIANAPDGAVVEIQSNESYVGTLAWTDKSLVVRAAPGFEPRIVGSPSSPAIRLTPGLVADTAGTFEGLVFEGSPTSEAIELLGSLSNGDLVEASFNGCRIEGSSSVVGNGSTGVARLTLSNCELTEDLSFTAIGQSRYEAVIDDSEIGGDVTLGASAFSSGDLTLNEVSIQGGWTLAAGGMTTGDVKLFDSSIGDGILVDLLGSANWQQESRRVRVVGGTFLSAVTPAFFLGVFESSTFESGLSGAQTGIETTGSPTSVVARFVNPTISDFPLGILPLDTGTSVTNGLFHRNAVDIATPQASALSFANCVIPDGTFTGQNGNVAGAAALDALFRPANSSSPVDVGDSTAQDLGFLDFYGNPRVQDGDGDGTPTVNAGAVETVRCQGPFFAVASSRLGWPANPDVLSWSGPPALGRVLELSVDHTTFLPNAVGDFLIVSSFPNNFFLPQNGTLCLDLSRIIGTQLRLAGERFEIQLPRGCPWLAQPVILQAVSLGPAGGIRFTNAVDCQLGFF